MRATAMRRRWTLGLAVLLCAATVVAASTAPANAAGVWDPDDTSGRLDIRWIGVRYTRSGDAVLTVTLYGSFRASALPKSPLVWSRAKGLEVELDAHQQASFFRRRGAIRVSYGDHGSSCCAILRVQRPSPTTLVTRYTPYDEGDPGHRVFGYSSYRRVEDVTDTFRLAPP